MSEPIATSSLASMTGFGHGSVSLAERTLRVEIRTLNHRGLDLKIRTQDCQLGAEVESEISRLIRQDLSRGTVQVTIRGDSHSGRAGSLDLEGLKQLHADLIQTQNKLGCAGEVNLQTLAMFYSTNSCTSPTELTLNDWPLIKAGIDRALAGVQQMRQKEGSLLAKDLRLRLTALRLLSGQMRESSAGVPSRAARKLQDRLASLGRELPPVDPGRLAQEIAILVERYDVSEELVRLHAHFDQLESLLLEKQKDAPGRRLDFLAQEMFREVNTIGSKIQDSATLALVVEAKAELDKLREQAQNIE